MILGMVGDLARTTLVPSLYALGCQRLLPEPFALLGVAFKTWDNNTFRKATRTYAKEKIGFGDATWQRFAKGLSFVRGGFDAPPTETIPGCAHALRSCRLSTIFPIIYCFISLSRHRSMEKLFTNLLPPRSSRVTALVGGVSVSKSCLAVTLPRHRRSTVSSQGEQRRTNLPYYRIACVESPRTMFVESVHTSTWLRGEKLVVAVCSKPARPASIPFMTENL